MKEEHQQFGELDFDRRVIRFITSISKPLLSGDDDRWHREIKKAKGLAVEMKDFYDGRLGEYTLMIDSVDDYWDGSDRAVIYLTALMHAALEISAQVPWARALMFLRENIFERVRSVDTEFSRLETSAVGLDWTQEQLVELVERRLNFALTTKFALDDTWHRFFEDSEKSRDLVLSYTQHRPRDVLTYCSLALETALSHNHEVISLEDLLDARRRFSDSRLKDLGDEYAENYPQLQVVLSRFYGLGRRFTLAGVDAFVQKLLIDDEVREACGSWIYAFTPPELFIRLMYNIGFFGIVTQRAIVFRSLGPRDTTPPAVDSSTDVVIHRSYESALDLQDIIVGTLDTQAPFGRVGIVADLPGGIDLTDYRDQLTVLQDDLKSLPVGKEAAEDFERIVGEVLRLCFFRSLTNVIPKEREHDGRVIRDWIASNRATTGFWELMRHRYDATQVVWECKNYTQLAASDFHQIAYYLNRKLGRFGVLVFRGEIESSYYKHLQEIASEKDAFVLLITVRDLQVFIRQSRNGKNREEHLNDRYDYLLRKIA